jgi:probable rRNA maturation factor
VITFDLSPIKTETEGEVYISIDRIKDNAKKEGVSFKEELHRVIFHGALHLCGYKDKKKKEALIMRSMENKYLKLYFK